MNELALFAGAGGGILGGKLLGWRTICAVEIDTYQASVLVARQNDGCLSPFPIWDDVRTFDGRPWNGIVDVVSGGFPCQDISAAGKGAGINGKKSGLWKAMGRIIGEVRPRFVLVENSPVLTCRGLGTVLGDLASMGYNASWGVLGAEDAIWDLCDPCIDHERARIFILGWDSSQVSNPGCGRCGKPELDCKTGAPEGAHSEDGRRPGLREVRKKLDGNQPSNCGWWSVEPDVGRVASGVPNRVDRLRGLGNAQVPAVVRLAWEVLTS
jgi:DNA (cytosine-5)-methyltransferase 1